MTTYVLAYDLRNVHGSQNYNPLWNELKKLSAHRVQDSFWLLNLNNTPKEVVEHFQNFVHKDDRLWVSELTKSNYYVGAMSGTNIWLQNNQPAR